ncbi:MAG: protein adenylyltransferase SelO family protein, partial [Luminiphilus sp.]|nr:protein adenylyltransferase SelO family protein [Luminiphilus sp.]
MSSYSSPDSATGFEHSYAGLGHDYAAPTQATPVSAPRWMAWNESLANDLQWPKSWRHSDETLATLAGNGEFEGSRPIATVYAGHQFGSYNPQLGDGRALLVGEWR